MQGRSINIPNVTPETRSAILGRLTGYERVVEIGIGNRVGIARALALDASVTATDVRACPVPSSVRFVQDDITDPTHDVYAGVDMVYALNLPPELHRSGLAVAERHDAVFVFSTLGTDPPTIPVTPDMLPGETLYWARQ